MRYAGYFSLFALGLVWLALRHGGAAYLLLWPAVSFLIVALAYAGAGARVFGKTAKGERTIWASVLLLPYLAFSWLVWSLNRLASRQACHHPIAPGIWLGRRPYERELPPEVTCVVDLACEFTPAKGIRDHREYICLPVLDTQIPPADLLLPALQRAAAHPGGIYVHCAAGHGRSAMFVAALLIARGIAADPDEAQAIIRRARPSISLSTCQRILLAEMANQFRPAL